MEKLNKYSTYNRKKDPQGSSSVSGKPRAAESLADNKRNNDNERCPYSRQCGGCDMQGSRYKRQLSRKQKRVAELTAGFGEVLPIVGMDDPKHYRNKVHHAFKRDRSGNIMSGPYERGSHWVINVDDCMLEDEDCQKVIHTIRRLVKTCRIRIYNEDTGEGVLRHVLMRKAFATGELMAVIVSGRAHVPDLRAFTAQLVRQHPCIRTVVLNINPGRTGMILGNTKEKVLYGPGYINDMLCGKRFRISAKSFYQVNPVQTEKLYSIALSYADLSKNDTVIDAYCGIGTIGICAADKAGSVIGVELNPDAVNDAQINAAENHVENISFYNDDAGSFMSRMVKEGKKADVVFMDPPRAGSTVEFMSSAVRLSPSRIVYISCEPETLARDLGYLTKHGYKVKKIRPVDMFPYTNHVETVVLMSRTK